MTDFTRREWSRMALTGLISAVFTAPGRGDAPEEERAGSPPPQTRKKLAGFPLGVHTFSFRDRSLDQTTPILIAFGLDHCELWRGHVEPKELIGQDADRDQLRRWRMNVSLAERAQQGAALLTQGLHVTGYELPFTRDCTDAEIERSFKLAQALGARLLTGTSEPEMIERVAPFAREYKIVVGFANSAGGPIRSPEDVDRLLARKESEIALTLDVAEIVAAGFDPLPVLAKHHERIAAVHLRDRKRNGGASVVWGEGDTPLREVLGMLRRQKRRPPVLVRYDYPASDPVDEVRRCVDFCVKELGA